MSERKETEIGRIPCGWDIKTIDEIKAKEPRSIISGPFGSNISSKFFVSDGIPVIRGNNLSLSINDKFIDDGFVFITEEKAKELGTWAYKDDLIFTAAGTIGQVGILNGNSKYSKYIISNKQLRVRLDKEIIEPLFAYYWFASPQMVDTVAQRDTGSTIPLINLSVLKGLTIPLPPLPEQQAIAGVLSSLDDKIDLLQRQNKTLEGMAEALWRKMFVEEADPGWNEFSLLEIIDLVGGGTPKTEISEYWNGAIPWLSGKDITTNHKSFVINAEKNISELGLGNSSTKILPKYATVISARGTVGNFCILSSPMAFSQTNYGILPKIDECYFFTYLLIGYSIDELKSAAYGCVFDTITTNTFREQKIPLPSNGEILSFEIKIKPYFEKMYNNTVLINTLSRLRDTLLPKLMSGEVRVRL